MLYHILYILFHYFLFLQISLNHKHINYYFYYLYSFLIIYFYIIKKFKNKNFGAKNEKYYNNSDYLTKLLGKKLWSFNL